MSLWGNTGVEPISEQKRGVDRLFVVSDDFLNDEGAEGATLRFLSFCEKRLSRNGYSFLRLTGERTGRVRVYSALSIPG